MKKTIILCLSILLIALTGCKKDKNSWGKLNEGAITINVGESKQLTFENDGNKYPQWSSEDTTIAVVNASGLVTGVRVGTVNILVNGLICKVTVNDQYMGVVEPIQDWTANYTDVDNYMIENIAATMTIIPTLDYDTMVFADNDTVIYVMTASYEYEATLEGQFVDAYEYEFDVDTTTRKPHLIVATMKINDAHTGEIKTFLNHRYVESNVTKGYYRVLVNNWYQTSHITYTDPYIFYSQEKLAPK